MTTVTVTSGWQPPENYFRGDDGLYEVTLRRIGASGDDGVFVDGATYEHEGAYGLKVKQTWQFETDDGQTIEQGVPIPKEGRLSPRSTFYAYSSALVGREPTVGTTFDTDALIGLRAKALIQKDDNEIPRIRNLIATKATNPAVSAPTPAPVAAPVAAPEPVPLRETVAAGAGNLPF